MIARLLVGCLAWSVVPVGGAGRKPVKAWRWLTTGQSVRVDSEDGGRAVVMLSDGTRVVVPAGFLDREKA